MTLRRIADKAFIFAIIFGIQPLITEAQTEKIDSVIHVGYYISPPFVMDNNGELQGVAIDIWEIVAKNLDLKYDYIPFDSYEELVRRTESGEVNVAVSNLTITPERYQAIDFTQPWFDGGMRILTNDAWSDWSSIWKALKESGHMRIYAIIFGFIILATILLTFFDRMFDKEYPEKWREGMSHSFFTIMSVLSSGSAKRKNLFGWVERFWAGIWLVFGVAVIAFFTSSLTSVLTKVAINSEINGIQDLSGKTIGVIAASTAEDFGETRGFDLKTYSNLEEAVEALESRSIIAVIGDAPNLEYYVNKNSGKPIQVVGKIFRNEKYCFGMTRDFPYSESITLEVLKLLENDKISQIGTFYFGHPH